MSASKGEKEQKQLPVEKAKAPSELKKVYIFPRATLNDALKVAEVIWEKNAGEPFALFDIAKQLGYSPTTGNFREIIRSAQKYGLTNEGVSTSDFTKTISLTELGNAIIAPTPEENVNALKRKALETPEIFQKALNLINGKIIPEESIFKNMLVRTFQMSKEDAEACYKVMSANIDELGLKEDYENKIYLRLDKLGSGKATVKPKAETPLEKETAEEPGEQVVTMPIPAPTPQQKVPWVFISHSKNKKILDQIKQMLDFGKFNYEIAEERESLAIPLSDKVFGLMQKCNCAIINISADEEKKQGDVYGINENVLIEIGGAFLHFNKRVILIIDECFKDKLPTIMKGLYAIFYHGDTLSWEDGMRLQKALTEFREKL